MYPASPFSTPPRKSTARKKKRKNKAVVSNVLSMLRLSHHEDAFSIHCVETMLDLQMLTEEQMKEMGMWKVGERNRLKRWVHQKLEPITESSAVEEDQQSVETSRPLHSISVRRKRTVRRTEITVVGAGVSDCNGVYMEKGEWDGVPKFVKLVEWAGQTAEMVLFRHRLVHDNSQLWFISIVPSNQNPGSSQDIAFYSSQSVEELDYTPPSTDWQVCSPDGREPAPSLETGDQQTSLSNSPERKSLEFSPERSWRAARSEPRVKIEGAGSDIVNGIYLSDGTTFDGCKMYKKGVFYDDKQEVMTLFRCLVRGNEQRWYLSIISEDNILGTVMDVDFYCAKISVDTPDLPPSSGWMISDEGDEPCPTVSMILRQSAAEAIPSDILSEHRPRNRLRVDGAGLSSINGLYEHRGIFDDVPKYQKPGFWKGSACVFTVFRYAYEDDRRRWYISVIPLSSSNPGTYRDIDLYAAPASNNVADGTPPRFGWSPINEGVGQAPTLTFVTVLDESTTESGREEATIGDEITTSVSGMTTEESPSSGKRAKSASNDDDQKTKKADDDTSGTRAGTTSTEGDGPASFGEAEHPTSTTDINETESRPQTPQLRTPQQTPQPSRIPSDDASDITPRTGATKPSWDPFDVLVTDVFGLGLSESPYVFDGASPRTSSMDR